MTGVEFFNENLELQTQKVLVQSTTTIEAAARVIASLHGLSAVDASGSALTLEQILEMIPAAPTEQAAATTALANDVRELKRQTKYLYDSVKVATRVPGYNGYHVLQELEHRLRMDLEEHACDQGHTFLTIFNEQAEAADKRLKANVPGSICPALALVNAPVVTIPPPKVTAGNPKSPADEQGAQRSKRPGRAAPYAPRGNNRRGPRRDEGNRDYYDERRSN